MAYQGNVPDVICFVYFHGEKTPVRTRKQWILPQAGKGRSAETEPSAQDAGDLLQRPGRLGFRDAIGRHEVDHVAQRAQQQAAIEKRAGQAGADADRGSRACPNPAQQPRLRRSRERRPGLASGSKPARRCCSRRATFEHGFFAEQIQAGQAPRRRPAGWRCRSGRGRKSWPDRRSGTLRRWLVAAVAPSGRYPAVSAFDRQTRSGVTAACSHANMRPVRPNPVSTSSAISSVLYWSHNRRTPARNSAGQTIIPPAACSMGSMSTAATESPPRGAAFHIAQGRARARLGTASGEKARVNIGVFAGRHRADRVAMIGVVESDESTALRLPEVAPVLAGELQRDFHRRGSVVGIKYARKAAEAFQSAAPRARPRAGGCIRRRSPVPARGPAPPRLHSTWDGNGRECSPTTKKCRRGCGGRLRCRATRLCREQWGAAAGAVSICV